MAPRPPPRHRPGRGFRRRAHAVRGYAACGDAHVHAARPGERRPPRGAMAVWRGGAHERGGGAGCARESQHLRGAEAVHRWICAQSFLIRAIRRCSMGPRRRAPAPRRTRCARRRTSWQRASRRCQSTASWCPFPFAGTVDPRDYALRLGRPTIVYKALGSMDEPAWRAWLAETAPKHALVSVVGRPTSGVKYALPLSRAIRIAAEHCTVGGVVIAERHTAERSEAARLLAKGIEGCGYFISQTVYHPDATERLLADYLRDCRGAGVEPRRIVLTFSPVGREKTMAFLAWLGVR